MDSFKTEYPDTTPATLNIGASRGRFNKEEDGTVDLRGLLLTIWHGKWTILITTMFAAAIGLFFIAQLEPTYRASAKVMFDIPKSNVVNIQDVLVDQQFDASKLEDQIQVLRSTNLIERVIKELDLRQNPKFNPLIRNSKPTIIERVTLTDGTRAYIEDLLTSIGFKTSPEPLSETKEGHSYERLTVIKNVLAGLELKPVGRSRVIEITYVSDDPRMSAAIANAIAEQYIVDQLEVKLQATRAATSWLGSRVENMRSRVQDSEEAVETARAAISGETGQTSEIARRQLDSLSGYLAASRNEVSRLQSLFDRLTTAIAQERDLGAVSEFRTSKLIESYRTQETVLLSEKRKLSADHPALPNLEQQITNLRITANQEALRIVAAAESDLKAAIAQEKSLIDRIQAVEQETLLQARNDLRLRQLDREAEASRVLYQTFLARLHETSEQGDLQEADARILSPAEEPLFPQAQAKQRMLIFSVFLGLSVGAALVLLLERFNDTFRLPQQLEDATGHAILGVLPSIGSNKQHTEVVKHLRNEPNSSMAEAVRNLRTSILFSPGTIPPKVVMFTSAAPGEGKSTTAMLTAMTSRRMGKSAIVLDCDLRLPALGRALNSTDKAPGLISVLAGESSVQDAIYTDPENDLDILMARPSELGTEMNPADVFSSPQFEELISMLSELYDLVILDTPPVLAVADARIVSQLVDAVVYTVRWGTTARGAVLEGLKELHSIRAPVAGIALTHVNETRAARYSYGGFSYYKGRYGDYYNA